jgi:hypothetical protein
MSVYSLELADGCFYVGYSDDVDRRIAEHFLGRAAMWTRMHAPIRVLDVVPGTKELENCTTIALMCTHGWRKVRGGAWCSIELKTMPLPLARALAGKPPPEIKVSGVSHDYNNHLIHVDGPPWTARISGPGTLDRLKGFRTFGSGTGEDARRMAMQWLDLVHPKTAKSVDADVGTQKETDGEDTLADEDVSTGHQRED